MKHRVPNWAMPEGKAEIISQTWGKQIPTSLYYFVGVGVDLSSECVVSLFGVFFRGPKQTLRRPRIDVGVMTSIPMFPTVIRIENISVAEIPLEVKVANRICPLCAVGEYDKPGFINFANPEMSEDSTKVE